MTTPFERSARLLSEMRSEERRNLAERFLALRQRVVELVLCVGFTFIDLKRGFDPRPSQLAMHANRVAQQQVTGAGGQYGGGKTVHVAIHRRDERILQVVPMRVDHCGRIAKSVTRHENVVDLLIRIEAVASLGGVRHWRSRTQSARRGQALLAPP